MTYSTGNSIQAIDYNTFATLSVSMDEVYFDQNQNSTTLPNAGYGYGQTTVNLNSVAVGNVTRAVEWANLFKVMRDCETHQNVATSNVTPPVPASGPVSGEAIVDFNTPTTMQAAVNLLRLNRHNVLSSQLSTVAGTFVNSTNPWTASLTYTFQVNFGAGATGWNNARYFFNTGGSIRITGRYEEASSPIENAWRDAISTPKAPFSFYWNRTLPASGSNDAVLNPIGFWKEPTNALTTAYQIVYRKSIGSGYYTSSFVQIEAKLNAVAGSNGLLDMRIRLLDGDPTPDVKVAGIDFSVGYNVSAGTIPYPGTISIPNGTYTYA